MVLSILVSSSTSDLQETGEHPSSAPDINVVDSRKHPHAKTVDPHKHLEVENLNR
uniref:Uncharacterized protein n=1 Tax=Arion vulgaris TaxID=1028688 RepID=A0A0B7A166_9EUPU